ncbi:hypothetical protein ACFPES_00490 [Paenibacillus sp. GCM10023248]|nr:MULTISPECIES: hypothetical protein [Bacillales]MDD9265499.1 hypothetical protein [Paenibacillus sp. MAHUQ-63]MDR6882448.1 L-alanine-DL-glutamate epimerase-like enolase superfamily enzyme [Bacillus sp. 3255]
MKITASDIKHNLLPLDLPFKASDTTGLGIELDEEALESYDYKHVYVGES